MKACAEERVVKRVAVNRREPHLPHRTPLPRAFAYRLPAPSAFRE